MTTRCNAETHKKMMPVDAWPSSCTASIYYTSTTSHEIFPRSITLEIFASTGGLDNKGSTVVETYKFSTSGWPGLA